MEPWLATIVLFGLLLAGIAIGLHIAFVLTGLGILFTLLLWGPQGLLMIVSTAYGKGTDFILVALPLFLLMGYFLEVSGVADELYEMMNRWVGHIPGGLASGTIVVGAIFAAMAGISGAAIVSMGLVALPSMVKRNYDKRLTLGTICAGGALGILIPPSIVVIIYCSLTGESVTQLYSACLIPGILLTIMHIIYISVRSFLQPHLAPATKVRYTWREKFESLKAVIIPIIIIMLVLGTMYLGICTPTEAAGIGTLGVVISCAIRRKLTWENVKKASRGTFLVSAMVLWIIFGSFCFGRAYSIAGAADLITNMVVGLQIPPMSLIWAMMLILFILGMFMGTAEICVLTTPIFLPIIHSLGFDPVWYGVLFVINAEMGLLSPPFGMTLFWLKGVAPPEISMGDIYNSVWPFIAVQMACLFLVMYFPPIAMWFPSVIS